MSSLPPPSGRPVTMFPRPDPWGEQQRRRERHREDQRRRRRRWLTPLLVAIGLAGTFLAVRATNDLLADDAAVAPTTPPTTLRTTTTTVAPEPTLAPEMLVEVDQVWLIDRGDGVFDWGVSVRTPPTAPTQSGVVIDVRLIASDDEVVVVADGEVNGIGPESVGTVAGRLTDLDGVPVRLEFDVTVGIPSNDRSLGDVLSVLALERTPDSVSGRIRSDVETSLEDVTMVLLWLDDDGEVVAAVPQPIEELRPDVDGLFDIDLGDEAVPDGRPNSVVWTQ